MAQLPAGHQSQQGPTTPPGRRETLRFELEASLSEISFFCGRGLPFLLPREDVHRCISLGALLTAVVC